MAVNQSPMYQKAEERYRCASTPAERLAALEEMWRLVPKHKASEKLQAQIKQRIKSTREDVQKHAAKGGHTSHDPYAIHKQGAGQVLLLGEPNVGKSAIVGALTSAKVEVQPFPHSTHHAVPGMAHHEDVPIQLVDMPPVAEGHVDGMMLAAYRRADAILLVVDLTALDVLDQLERPVRLFEGKGMRFTSDAVLDYGALGDGEEADASEPQAIPKRVLVAANKADAAGAMDNFEGLKELSGTELTMMPVSAETRQGLPEMMASVFGLLHVIRVYSKKPGKPVDKTSPFILPVGGTVADLAELIHSELAEKLRSARVWGGTVHSGQQVHSTHVLTDKDVVELHF